MRALSVRRLLGRLTRMRSKRRPATKRPSSEASAPRLTSTVAGSARRIAGQSRSERTVGNSVTAWPAGAEVRLGDAIVDHQDAQALGRARRGEPVAVRGEEAGAPLGLHALRVGGRGRRGELEV